MRSVRCMRPSWNVWRPLNRFDQGFAASVSDSLSAQAPPKLVAATAPHWLALLLLVVPGTDTAPQGSTVNIGKRTALVLVTRVTSSRPLATRSTMRGDLCFTAGARL